MRHQRNREFAVRILRGHHKCLSLLHPGVVERCVVHSRITLDDDITESGSLGRQVFASIDDEHVLAGVLQWAGYQAANRAKSDDNDMVAEIVELAFHLLVLPKRNYGIPGK